MTTILTFENSKIILLVMLSTNSAKFINFVSVLQNPSDVVPSLSNNEIYTILVDSIRAYINQDIGLETLVDIATKIKLFNGIKEDTDDYIDEALIRLVKLSKYLKSSGKNIEIINKILIETLDRLSK